MSGVPFALLAEFGHTLGRDVIQSVYFECGACPDTARACLRELITSDTDPEFISPPAEPSPVTFTEKREWRTIPCLFLCFVNAWPGMGRRRYSRRAKTFLWPAVTSHFLSDFRYDFICLERWGAVPNVTVLVTDSDCVLQESRRVAR